VSGSEVGGLVIVREDGLPEISSEICKCVGE